MVTKIKKSGRLSGLLFLISIVSFSGSAAALNVPENLTAGWDTITQKTLKKDVSYLASDKMQGRLALENGDNSAIKWLENQFKEAGLKPAVGDSYLQKVNLIEYMPDCENNYISLKTAGKTIKWKEPEIVMEYPEAINMHGDVYFAGYGITAPALNYDDYQGTDVKGKIVLVFEHEPQEKNANSIFNGTGNTIYATSRIKALNAQKHGAIAIFVAPEPNRKHLSNQERRAQIGGSVERDEPVPSMVLAQDELHIPIIVISDKAAKKIAGKSISLSSLQTQIDTQLKPQSQPIPGSGISIYNKLKWKKEGTSYNVAGLLEGSDPVLKNETVIISGHHDHDGMSGKYIWRGADDNASGSVGVVTLARAMKDNVDAKNGLAPKRSILFVVFTAEERGLLGAYYLAGHPLRPLETTRAMINFDMIGRNEVQTPQTRGMLEVPAETKNRLNLIGSHYSPDYKNIVEAQNQYVGLTLDDRFDKESALNVFFRSDQFPFVLHEIPSFWWFTGFHPDYHHITDTADKINYAKMQKILRLAYLTVYALADEDNYPAFVKNPGLQ